jgi:hypothetical protein
MIVGLYDIKQNKEILFKSVDYMHNGDTVIILHFNDSLIEKLEYNKFRYRLLFTHE